MQLIQAELVFQQRRIVGGLAFDVSKIPMQKSEKGDSNQLIRNYYNCLELIELNRFFSILFCGVGVFVVGVYFRKNVGCFTLFFSIQKIIG